MEFAKTIEILGTLSFAMSGSFAAMQKRLDPFGVIIIAFVTSIGGGTLRDILLNRPIQWMISTDTIYWISAAALFSMLFKSIENNFKVTLFIFDSLGLGLFTIAGIDKGLSMGYPSDICLILGTITGCAGGIFRDMLLTKIPLIFQREIYATACILGGVVYFSLRKWGGIPMEIIQIIATGVVVTTRVLAVKLNWQIPKFYDGNSKGDY